MPQQLRDPVRLVGEYDPPLDLHTRVIKRERELPVEAVSLGVRLVS